MKKAFVISWYFPPINSSEGLVTFKLLKNSKGKYDVFTQKSNLSWTYGDREEKLVSDNIHPIFAKSKDIKDWVLEGIEYFDKHHDEYSYIMSRSMAPESHEIALAIKKKYPNIKWIASFGDPIYDNPYLAFYKETSPYSASGLESGDVGFRYVLSLKRIIKDCVWKIRHKRYLRLNDTEGKNKELQFSVFSLADKIILNNDYQKAHMLKNFENIESKIIVLPHSYDKDFYPKRVKKNEDGKIHFVFLGHLDNIRTPKLFLESLSKIKKNDENLGDKISVDFYGDMSSEDKLYIIDNFLCDVVHIRKSVDYFTSLKIMCESDYLLSFDANLSGIVDANIFFPAKIADYLGSKRPIFAVSMIDGASADIFRKTGAILCSNCLDDVYMHLVLAIEGKLDCSIHDTDDFDAINVAKKYDEEVEKLV